MITHIKNAIICDGTLQNPYQGDILVQDGKIDAVGHVGEVCADQVMDADGMVASPGFVDVHRHLDFNALTNPRFGEIELAQGITTGIGGNCGLAPYPCTRSTQKQVYDFIRPCLGGYDGTELFGGTGDFLKAIAAREPYLNVGLLAATGALKSAVKGFEKSPYTTQEMAETQRLLCDSLEQGAVGISCGIMYTPECYSSTEEYVTLLKPAAKYGRVLTSHIRGEGDGLVSSVQEVIEIAKRAGLPLNISHFKSVGKKNWQSEIFKAIDVIEKERAHGFDVTADFYPYTGGATTLLTLLPPTFVQEQTQATLQKLATKAGVEELKISIQKPCPQWDNMVTDIGWDRIVISGVTLAQNRRYQGKDIMQICEMYHFADPVEFIAQLLVEEEGQVSIIVMSMCQEDLDTITKLSYTALISDSLYGTMDNPHPRLYASFSKMIRETVCERKILTLEQAIHKMTLMPAQRFSMPQKGLLAAGKDADILLFHPENIRDNATFSTPNLLASGMDTVFVHGKIAMKNNILKTRNGQTITV